MYYLMGFLLVLNLMFAIMFTYYKVNPWNALANAWSAGLCSMQLFLHLIGKI